MFTRAKAITAGVLVFALGGVLLIAQPFGQQGGSVLAAGTDGAGLEPATVTGTFEGLATSSDVETDLIDGYARNQSGWTGRLEMSDPRLTGGELGAQRSRYYF